MKSRVISTNVDKNSFINTPNARSKNQFEKP